MNGYYLAFFVTLGCFLLTANSASAGVLELTNGDLINGELMRVKGDSIEWKSPALGELSIQKEEVASLTTKQLLKFSGYDSACLIRALNNGVVYYQCGKAFSSVSLLTLKSVAPYESAAQVTDYSRGNLSLLGEESVGNDINADWTLEAAYEKRKGDWRHNPSLRFNQNSETNEDVKVSNELLFSEYSLDWFFRPNWFWSFKAEAKRDEKKELKLRTEYGVGMGYQFWQTAKSALSTELGVTLVDEQFEDVIESDGTRVPSSENNEYSSLLWSVNFLHELPRNLRLTYEHEFNASLEDSEDWNAEVRAGLSFPMGYGLSTDLHSIWDYDNTPNEGLEKLDRKTSVGISYRW